MIVSRTLKLVIGLFFIMVLLIGCGVDKSEELHSGIIQDMQYHPDKNYTAAVKKDTYYVWVNDKRYRVTDTQYQELEVGLRIEFTIIGSDIIHIKSILLVG